MDDRDAEFLKRLLETFKAEGAEHLEVIASSLLELERNMPAEEAERVVEIIFREAHSMKGAARSVNLSGIERICQSLESVFAALKKKELTLSPRLFDILHRAVNLLYAMLASPEDDSAERGPAREIVSGLSDIITRREETPVAEVPPLSPAEGVPPPQAAHLLMAETVRVAKTKLDLLLLQGEGFLALKQAAAQRSSEMAGAAVAAAELANEWSVLQGEMKDSEVRNSPRLQQVSERLASLSGALGKMNNRLDQDRRSAAMMIDTLLDTLKSVSMFPFSSLLDMMGKVVRDLAHDQGKQVRLLVTGGEIEADRRILDEMREPLIHLVRNCIDHGIENPEERRASGKDETGELRIEIGYREGQWIELIVADDGKGIDPERVKNSAVRLGLISPEEAERLNEEGVASLMFRSGVSASRMITEISGRGLGLAIVRERVERLGGSIGCETAGGKGTLFRILLPLTLATFRGLLVRCGERHFVIPSTAVRRTARVGADEIRRNTVIANGRIIPVALLETVLELAAHGSAATSPFARLVILGAGGERVAFRVDEVLHEQEVLVKHLGPQLPRVRNVLAATILGNGEVVPILNVPDLIKSALRAPPPPAPEAHEEEAERKVKSILVVEDSITSRSLLKNILQAAGYAVRTAVDGVEGFRTLQEADFDLVVSDVDMPGMNGFELTAKIRSDRRLASLPVIIVTSLASREDQERGIDAGASAYLVKSSFDQSNLLEVIRRLL
ncbi:response regulator [Geobacter sp. DSM 9736]|uniref:hybrid sensor histidine kinase/response regulator n=1 Tax=Geobacter sp. DSM 9736 TaxID=1277350 RepID=UPI000B50221C|nr:response regulator [Geobacter sp. DSM 9736]SNB44744.1 CheA signal transduction histidine kinase [Geobacter sp. DSM 9736]